MILFAAVFLVPLLIAAFVFYTTHEISWRELIVQVVLQLIVAGSTCWIVSCANTHDVEILSGRVTAKHRDVVSCSHSYPCNCRPSCSSSTKTRTCTTVCSTCYHHTHDYDWNVDLSTGHTSTIARVDWQGVHEPPRFSSVAIGEPASSEHSYENYIKGAPDTLFRRQGLVEKYKHSLPAYPGKVYDYYRINRFVGPGSSTAWNEALAKLNAGVGETHQATVGIVTVNDAPHEWFHALEESWIGGKKNDVIVVVGMSGDQIAWVDVMAWVIDPTFKVRLRDELAEVGRLDRDKFIDIIGQNVVKYYERKPMKDFEYLKTSITPSVTQWIISLIIAIAVGAASTWFMHRHDIFGDNGFNRYY